MNISSMTVDLLPSEVYFFEYSVYAIARFPTTVYTSYLVNDDHHLTRIRPFELSILRFRREQLRIAHLGAGKRHSPQFFDAS